MLNRFGRRRSFGAFSDCCTAGEDLRKSCGWSRGSALQRRVSIEICPGGSFSKNHRTNWAAKGSVGECDAKGVFGMQIQSDVLEVAGRKSLPTNLASEI